MQAGCCLMRLPIKNKIKFQNIIYQIDNPETVTETVTPLKGMFL